MKTALITVMVTLSLIAILVGTAFYFRPGLWTDEEGTAKALEFKAYYDKLAAEYPEEVIK